MSRTSRFMPLDAATTRRHSGMVARRANSVADADRDAIVRALDACAGNQTKAAAMLGIARRTLINRIERFGLPRPKKG